MDDSKAGFIYVLQMEGHPYYKIGRTKRIDRRMSQITPLLPTTHNLIAYYRVEDSIRDESALHKEFRGQRMNGEWFRLEDLDLAFIHACCLYHQTLRLCRRLADILSVISGSGLTPYAFKLVKALERASRRLRRRQMAFLGYSFDRQMRERVDPVLESEFVG